MALRPLPLDDGFFAMGNVLQFRLRLDRRKDEPMYWMCDCGCATFYHLSDGLLECAECDSIQYGYATDFGEGS